MIIYDDDNLEYKDDYVKSIKLEKRREFGHQHSKIMLLGYTDQSMRVVVGSANVRQSEWTKMTQGVWIGPHCNEVSDEDLQSDPTKGESCTGFRADLVEYLELYKLADLERWISRIKRTNFEAVK